MSKNASKTILAYSTLGIQLAALMVVFVYGGYKLDIYFNSSPWFVLAGAFIGMGAGLYNLIKGLKQMDKLSRQEKEEKEKESKWL